MGEMMARDDYKIFEYPRLYYPGQLLSIQQGSNPEQYVTLTEVIDLDGPWVKLVYRPTTRMDRVRDWLYWRCMTLLCMLPRWGHIRFSVARWLGLRTAKGGSIWVAEDDDAQR